MKTAREVIHYWGLSEEGYENTDALIAALDAAGFVLVPKEFVICYPGIPDAWRVKPEDLEPQAGRGQ